MPDSEGHGRENDRFCGWCGVMTDHHTAEHEEARVKRSRLPEAHGRDREQEIVAVVAELKHNDECGPGPVSDAEYRADAEAILAALDRVRAGRAQDDAVWSERVREVVDQAHAENWGGDHREGFCKACADAYLVAQYAVPGGPGDD